MKPIAAAIYSRWNISGLSLYFGEAPQSAVQPYATWNIISETPDWTFCEDFEAVNIQISVFDKGPSAENLLTYIDSIKSRFDFCEISPTGYSTVHCFRRSGQIVKETGEYFHGILEYEFLFAKS